MIIDLREFLNNSWAERYSAYLPTARALWENHALEATEYGVESSTTRGIRTGGRGTNGPQALFRVWAQAQLVAMLNDGALPGQLHSQEAFDAWHMGLAESLGVHWQSGTGGKQTLSVAHNFKLLDLFIRWLRVGAKTAPALVAVCERYGHIPLDRKSLHVLSETFGGIGLAGPFSMGDVHTQEAYYFYQALARHVCGAFGGSPLLFDVFCWNHPDAHALYNVDRPSRRYLPVPAT